MDINSLFLMAINTKASDIHLTVGSVPIFRIDGVLRPASEEVLTDIEMKNITKLLMSESQYKKFTLIGDLDFVFVLERYRFRLSAFIQQGNHAIVVRIINTIIPTMDELGLPMLFKDLVQKKKGLILVTGPTGSGKSTTLAAMIDYINNNSKRHIITLEDPIEYVHKHKKSIINQREVGRDTKSFSIGLRAALRQDPDVILVGEMRDIETMSTTITAAETGHLVLSTLHTNGAANTIDRIIDVFNPHQQQQIRTQLASVIEGVISQQLIPRASGKGRVAAFEIMTGTNAVRNLIREDKIHQITTSMQTGMKYGMQTMQMALDRMVVKGAISSVEAKRILTLF